MCATSQPLVDGSDNLMSTPSAGQAPIAREMSYGLRTAGKANDIEPSRGKRFFELEEQKPSSSTSTIVVDCMGFPLILRGSVEGGGHAIAEDSGEW